MAKSETISHTGMVTGISGKTAVVEIVSASACSSCSAAGLCSMAEAVRKQIEVAVPAGETYAVGEQVEVCLTAAEGMKAVVAAYVIPLFILLILCVSLSYTGLSELLIGAAGIGALAVYYLILYLARGRLAGGYVFRIRKMPGAAESPDDNDTRI